ncbi:hypothetical protein STEG23_015232, partial [Scotinomys teguina]
LILEEEKAQWLRTNCPGQLKSSRSIDLFALITMLDFQPALGITELSPTETLVMYVFIFGNYVENLAMAGIPVPGYDLASSAFSGLTSYPKLPAPSLKSEVTMTTVNYFSGSPETSGPSSENSRLSLSERALSNWSFVLTIPGKCAEDLEKNSVRIGVSQWTESEQKKGGENGFKRIEGNETFRQELMGLDLMSQQQRRNVHMFRDNYIKLVGIQNLLPSTPC